MRRGITLTIYIVVGVLVFLWLIKVPVLSFALTKKLRVPVSMEWVTVWWDQTTVRDFSIRNPKGFHSRDAFRAQETTIDYHLKELFSDPTVIEKIELNTIFVDVELSSLDGSKNNWTAISDGMPKQKSSHPVMIRKLILTNFTISIQGLGVDGATTTRHFERLEFDNIDSEHGFPTEQLIHKVFGGLDLDDFIKDAFNPVHLIEDAVDPFRIF